MDHLAAEDRQGVLTKPPGALGRLETIAIHLASLQGQEKPVIDQVEIVVYAADHGVVAEGISLFPQVVTYEMVTSTNISSKHIICRKLLVIGFEDV